MTRLIIIGMLTIFVACLQAQLTPWEAVKIMKRGINIGNSLEALGGNTSDQAEISWGNPKIFEAQFDDYKNAGFTAIRIPITWGLSFRTSTTSPYTIIPSFLDRVEQVVDWALNRGFLVIINAHHEWWLKENFTESNMARFDSIWAQVSRRFKNKSDYLLFEIINEPHPLSLENTNKLNKQVLATIRKTNPTRIVLFSGHMWSNADELLVAEIPNDTMLIGYYHSYDPYPFGLEGPGTFGSDSDIASVNARFLKVKNWSNTHNIPVILGEFGATKKCEYNSRMTHYATIVDLSQVHQIPFFAWDDGGDFAIYSRTTRTWNEIKDILIYTYPQSPYKLKIGNYADTLIQIQWQNRNPFNDSIVIERKVQTGNFVTYAKIGPNETRFIDYKANQNKLYYYYRLITKINDTTSAYSYPVRLKNDPIIRAPYEGKPKDIPGIIEAENFDIGKEGETYHDSDIDNLGNEYRLGPGVDIYKSGSNVYYVANILTGEWLEYTVNVKQKGKYAIAAYLSSPLGGGKLTLHFIKNNAIATIDVLKTDEIKTFVKHNHEIVLDSGIQVMRLKIDQGPEFGINRIILSFLTNVENKNTSNEIKAFPNPTNGLITLKTDDYPFNVQLFNVCGVLLLKTTVLKENQLINISHLPEGLYYIKCIYPNKVQTLKIYKY